MLVLNMWPTQTSTKTIPVPPWINSPDEAMTTVPYTSLKLNTQLAARLCSLVGCEKKMCGR